MTTTQESGPQPDVEERVRALRFVNQELQQRVSLQVSAGERVETKAIFLAGFSATALQFLVARHARMPWMALALASYTLAILGGLWAALLRRLRTVPTPSRLRDVYEELVAAGVPNLEEALLGRVAGTRVEAFALNERVDNSRIKGWWVAIVGLTLGLALSVPAMWGSASNERSVERTARSGCRAVGHPDRDARHDGRLACARHADDRHRDR